MLLRLYASSMAGSFNREMVVVNVRVLGEEARRVFERVEAAIAIVGPDRWDVIPTAEGALAWRKKGGLKTLRIFEESRERRRNARKYNGRKELRLSYRYLPMRPQEEENYTFVPILPYLVSSTAVVVNWYCAVLMPEYERRGRGVATVQRAAARSEDPRIASQDF
jgi:hypothetical protein